jgi:hypothetical protein
VQSKQDREDQPGEGVRPDAPVPPGVYIDPWDEPLDPDIVEPGEPLEPRAPPGPVRHDPDDLDRPRH